jgi:hypothetical protein
VSPPAVKVVPAAKVGRPLGFSSLAVKDARRVYAVTPGDFEGVPDQLWSVDTEAGMATKLLDASGPYVLGALVLDPAAERLLVTDGTETAPRLHAFDIAGAGAAAGAPVTTSATMLLPRDAALY